MAMKTAEIDFVFLPYKLLIHLSDDFNTLEKAAKRYKYPVDLPEDVSPMALFHSCEVYGQGMIWLDINHVAPGVAAHEALHASADIMTHVGSACEELQAYLIQHIVKIIMSL